MKALAAALILSVLFLAFFVFKFIQHKRKYDKIYESFTIKPDPERITTQTLYEHGFRIHDTKSKVYAVHPNVTTTSTHKTCIVCGGIGTQTVIETTEQT